MAGAAALLALAVVLASTGMLFRNGGNEASHHQADSSIVGSGQGRGQFSSNDPTKPVYPKSFEVQSLTAAQAAASVKIWVPETKWANRDNIMAIFVLPGGAVALDYPSPETPAQYVRQAYIEVYEAPWDPNRDPQKAYQQNLQSAPNPDASLTTIDGFPALTVTAHSEADTERANPAFLRVVVNGTELQVSGGENLDTLQSIASSIIAVSARS